MADVLAYAEGCFTGSPGDQVGVELEFLVHDVTDPALTVPIARVTGALGGLTLPGGSVITFEPGGQIELLGHHPDPCRGPWPRSSRMSISYGPLWALPASALGRSGVDGHRRPLRQLHTPRYDAMAACLGEPYGPLMMCSTASIQVNLDFGPDPYARWRRAHLFGPVLVAAFANSPGPVPGFEPWMSGRQAIWLALDPSRTAPVGPGHLPAEADLMGARRPVPVVMRVSSAAVRPSSRWIRGPRVGHRRQRIRRSDAAFRSFVRGLRRLTEQRGIRPRVRRGRRPPGSDTRRSCDICDGSGDRLAGTPAGRSCWSRSRMFLRLGCGVGGRCVRRPRRRPDGRRLRGAAGLGAGAARPRASGRRLGRLSRGRAADADQRARWVLPADGRDAPVS